MNLFNIQKTELKSTYRIYYFKTLGCLFHFCLKAFRSLVLSWKGWNLFVRGYFTLKPHLKKLLGDILFLMRIYWMFSFSFFFFFSFCLSRSLLFAFLPAFQILKKFLPQISKLWNTEYRIPVTKKVYGVFSPTSVGFGSSPPALSSLPK